MARKLSRMSRGASQTGERCRRHGWAALCVLLVVSLASVGLSVSPTSAQSSGEALARVWARKLASGNVEFGLSVWAAGSSTAVNVAVTDRYFPYERASVGTWYNSEAVDLHSGADRTLVAIRARRLASGNLEFALRVYGSTDSSWIPRARYFLYASAVEGSAAYSSPFNLGQHDRACLDGAVPDPAANVGLFRDCEVLLVAKDALVVTDRFRPPFSSWTGTNPISAWTDRWANVTLTDDRVSRLYVRGNPVTGKLARELGKLDQLVSLEIGGMMTGSIPSELGNLTNLERLVILSDSLTGSIPTELGNLKKLETLQLNIGSVTGSIPAELGKLKKLETLRLSVRNLTGPIPPELGGLTNLETFVISRFGLSGKTALTGSIPAELGNLSNLLQLSITLTNLTGSIPAELGNLSNLRQLDIGNNALTSSIPSELANLSNLTFLDLRENALDGAIPSELGNLSNLEQLRLNGNKLAGAIPTELGNLSSLQVLYLDDNKLENAIPSSLSSLSALTHLDLSDNSLSGNFPVELAALAPATPPTPPENGGSLIALNIRDNPDLSGCIPSVLRPMTRYRGIGHLTFCP